MFSTWKFQTTDNGAAELSKQPQVFDPMTARTKGPQACMHCRAKKVGNIVINHAAYREILATNRTQIKCTGEETGCERCRTLVRKCVYAKGGSGPKHRSTSSREKRRRRPSVQQSQAFPTPALTPEEEPLSSLIDEDFSWIECSDESIQDTLINTEVDKSQSMIIDLTDWDTRTVMPSMGLELAEPATPLEKTTTDIGLQYASDDSRSSIGAIKDVPEWGGHTFGIVPDLELPSPSTTVSTEPCNCLRRVVLLMDEAKSLTNIDARAVDSTLATNKEALSHGRDMLACTTCVLRVEYMAILMFMLDEMVRLAQSITNLLQPQNQKMHVGRIKVISFGNYEVDSCEEYSIIVRGLLSLQLKELQSLTKRLREVSQQVHSNYMAKRLESTEAAITAMLQRCRS